MFNVGIASTVIKVIFPNVRPEKVMHLLGNTVLGGGGVVRRKIRSSGTGDITLIAKLPT